MKEAFACKSFSHFVNKNVGVFGILTFEILTTLTNDMLTNDLTNDVDSFEQQALIN